MAAPPAMRKEIFPSFRPCRKRRLTACPAEFLRLHRRENGAPSKRGVQRAQSVASHRYRLPAKMRCRSRYYNDSYLRRNLITRQPASTCHNVEPSTKPTTVRSLRPTHTAVAPRRGVVPQRGRVVAAATCPALWR